MERYSKNYGETFLKLAFRQRTEEKGLAAHLTKKSYSSSSDHIITNLPYTRLATGYNKRPVLYRGKCFAKENCYHSYRPQILSLHHP